VLNALIYVKYDTGHNMQKHFNQLIICTTLEATNRKPRVATEGVAASASTDVARRVLSVLCLLLHVNNFKSCSCEMWHLKNTAGGCIDSMDM